MSTVLYPTDSNGRKDATYQYLHGTSVLSVNMWICNRGSKWELLSELLETSDSGCNDSGDISAKSGGKLNIKTLEQGIPTFVCPRAHMLFFFPMAASASLQIYKRRTDGNTKDEQVYLRFNLIERNEPNK